MHTHLKLGRISNLPTVWTNALAAGAIVAASAPAGVWLALITGLSLFYVAGMYYNDACDADYDRQHQPWRPIAAGLISRYRVEAWALAYALAGFLCIYTARLTAPQASGAQWLLWLVALTVCIVTYNRHHKNNPLSPLLMGGCRASVLLIAGTTLSGQTSGMLVLAVTTLLAWLIALTFLAKHEKRIAATGNTEQPVLLMVLIFAPVMTGLFMTAHSSAVWLPLIALLWVISQTTLFPVPWNRSAPHSSSPPIGMLIAGICLVDGLFLGFYWGVPGALISLSAFVATLGMQRVVAGT